MSLTIRLRGRMLTSLLMLTTAAVDARTQNKRPKPDPDAPSARLQDRVEALMEALDESRAALERDSLRDALRKQRELRAELDEFARAALSAAIDRDALGRDYVRFVAETSPRLSGRVVSVGPNGQFDTLAKAMPEIAAGDLVLLGEGAYRLPEGHAHWTDVAFLGLGAERTELRAEFRAAQRVRIDSIRIHCDDNPFLDLRRDDAVHVRNCKIGHYNSGAGGSNAVYATNSVLLIENCEFDGQEGRAKGARRFGNAFDLRGDNALYVRSTEFVDNGEILRATCLAVFDNCRSTRSAMKKRASGISPYPAGYVLLRNNKAGVHDPAATHELDLATDDLAIVEQAFHGRRKDRDAAPRWVDTLGLARSPTYWIPLLAHDNTDIRQLAIARIGAMLHKLAPESKAELGETKGISALQRKSLVRDLRTAELLHWWDRHQDELEWSTARRRYVRKR